MKCDVKELIKSYPELFNNIPTQMNVLKHDIDVGDHKPIKQHAYRVHPDKRAIMQQEAKYLLEHGFAIPSNSSWSSPSLLFPKSDQSPRFCNEYRKVNAVTKPDSFPLPRMDDCIDRVGTAKFVSKLELLKGYWQVPLTQLDHVKTLHEIFSRLKSASLTLNLAKCEFGKAIVSYLGKKVGQGQIRPVEAKVQAISDFPAPQMRRELRCFLGMAGY